MYWSYLRGMYCSWLINISSGMVDIHYKRNMNFIALFMLKAHFKHALYIPEV